MSKAKTKNRTSAKDMRFIADMEFRVETEEREDGEVRKIIGHAAVFDKPADLHFFREIIKPGAFAKTIQEDDIRALFNHDPNFVLGRNKPGTLALREDDTGLHMEITPPDTQYARDLVTSIDRGDISGGSIGFRVRKQDWQEEVDDDENELLTRIIREAQLFDVSPVTFPAYEETDVGLRKSAEKIYTEYRASQESESTTISSDEPETEPPGDSSEEERAAVKAKHDRMSKELQILELEV